MSTFDDTLNAALSDALDHVGTAVIYTPLSGDTFTVKVMPSAEDVETDFSASRIKSDAVIFEAKVSDINIPVKGDKFTYKAKNYIVKSYRYVDEHRLLWLLDCYPE